MPDIWSFLDTEIDTPVKFTDNFDESVLELASKARSTVEGDGQRFELEFRLADPLGAGMLGAALSVHRAKHRRGRPFTLPMPQHVGMRSLASPALCAVRAPVAAGAKSIEVRALATAKPAQAGRFVQIAAHPKVHQILSDTRDVGTDADSTLELYPALAIALTVAHRVDFNPVLRAKWGGRGVFSTTYRRGVMVAASIHVIEAV